KWDRPGLDALALMDEVQQRTGLLPTPITWPVGQSGDFRGVLDRITGEYTKYTRTDGGATIAGEETFAPEAAAELEGEAWTTAVDESELLDMEDQNHDQETFLAGKSTPVMFASAVLNFGIHKLLDTL
ncbi:peptide chain release factor 3, partial [Burkholderia multivorans]